MDARESSQRYYAKLRADPEPYQRFLERQRRRYAFKRAAWTERDREAARQASRCYRERLKSDPVKYAERIERNKQQRRASYWNSHESRLAQQRAYLTRHRQEIYERNREYARRNRDKIRAQQHAAYVRDLEANRAKDRERRRQSYAENPQAHLDYMKQWRAANPDRARAYVRLSGHRRRAAAGGEFIRVDDWEALLKKHEGRCGYCGVLTAQIKPTIVYP